MYSGTSISINFKGSSAALVIKNDSAENYFNIIIDGHINVLRTNNKDSIYQLAASLPDKLHQLTIFRRTEWHGGNSTFLGMKLSSGAKIFKPEKPKRQIEFIGNSITCAYGNEGSGNADHFKYSTENNYLSYSAITARELKAGYTAVCRSGIGLYNGRGDTSFAMVKLYETICNNCKVKWEYTVHPDLIVIELGNNDFAVDPDSSKFVNSYVSFLRRLRSKNSGAKIVCLAGPYNGGPGIKWNKFQNFVKAAVITYAKSNKDVYYFNLGTIKPLGSDWHPSVRQHQQLADSLVPFIVKLTHWK